MHRRDFAKVRAMRTWGKRSIVVAGSIVMLVVLTSCGMGKTLNADQITLSSMRLNGEVSNTVVGDTTYWFEYGLTPEYGSTTPVETLYAAEAEVGYPVSATITGLAEGTDYFYRVCANNVADGKGSCGANSRSGTAKTVAWDAVNGAGYVVDDPTSGLKIGGSISTRETYDPEYGYGWVTTEPSPSPYEHFGQASCIAVQGNRASMGFVDWSEASYEEPHYFIVFVEDNGPTGDRWGRIEVDADPTTCPVPTAADFPDFVVGSTVIPPILTTGDFVVHDQP